MLRDVLLKQEKYVQDGRWTSWGPPLSGKDVYGSTVGIFGMGAIGQAFARRLTGFNTRTLYHNRSRREDVERELKVTYADFDTLLEESDFVICTAPLTVKRTNLMLGHFKR